MKCECCKKEIPDQPYSVTEKDGTKYYCRDCFINEIRPSFTQKVIKKDR